MAAGLIGILLFAEPGPDALGAGSTAPVFKLSRLGDGGSTSLGDLRGKVVLVNFWATWCKPCEDEMPAMQRLYETLRGEPFELLAVSVDEDPALVSEFVQRLSLSFPVLLDPSRSVSHAYQTFRYPETWLIDREGRIAGRFVGPREWDSDLYVQRVRALIASPATS